MISINLSNDARQSFSVVINGKRCTFDVTYSVAIDRWSMDISIDAEPVITGRKIVEGSDLVEPFNLDIGKIFAYSESGAEANRDNIPLGIVKLYNATQEEIDAAVAS